MYISLVGDGSNCALDYGSENGGVCRINGDIVVACGGSTMLETMSETSAQPSILYAGTTQAAGTEISLQNASGETLLTYTAANSFSAVLVSCPEMQTGSTYTLTLGETTQEITLSQVATTYGVSGGMGGGMGDMGGQGGMNGGPGGGFTPTSATADTDSDTADTTASTLAADTAADSTIDSTDRPTPPDGSDFDGTMPTAPDGSTDQPASGDQTTGDQQTETEDTFTLDENGKWLLIASAAALVLGLTVAVLYRKD